MSLTRGDIVLVDFLFFTIEQRKSIRYLGHLSPSLLRQVDDCLKAALSLL
jgi:hypothetical protein